MQDPGLVQTHLHAAGISNMHLLAAWGYELESLEIQGCYASALLICCMLKDHIYLSGITPPCHFMEAAEAQRLQRLVAAIFQHLLDELPFAKLLMCCSHKQGRTVRAPTP